MSEISIYNKYRLIYTYRPKHEKQSRNRNYKYYNQSSQKQYSKNDKPRCKLQPFNYTVRLGLKLIAINRNNCSIDRPFPLYPMQFLEEAGWDHEPRMPTNHVIVGMVDVCRNEQFLPPVIVCVIFW